MKTWMKLATAAVITATLMACLATLGNPVEDGGAQEVGTEVVTTSP